MACLRLLTYSFITSVSMLPNAAMKSPPYSHSMVLSPVLGGTLFAVLDTFTLLEEIFELDFDQIVEQYPKLNSLEECLDAITMNAKEKKHAIMHVYRSDRKNIYVDVLWKMCEYVTKKYLSTVFPDVQLSDYDRQLITRYFKCSCFGLTIDWIKTGMKDEYIEDMHRILQQSKGVADLIIKNCIESQQ